MEMNKQTRLNTLANLAKLRTDVDLIRQKAMDCEPELLVNTIKFVRKGFTPMEQLQNFFDKYKKCQHCGKWHLKEVMVETADDGFYCPTCIGAHCHLCSACKKWHARDSCSERGICSKCWEKKFVCHSCGEVHEKASRKKGIDGNYYCPDCYEGLFVVCQECGETVYRVDALEHRGDMYCSACYDSRGFDAEDLIREYSYKPRYPNYGKDRRFGVEIELEGEWRSAKKFKEATSEVYMKRDGSLNSGFEVVTHPLLLADIIKTCRTVGEVAQSNDMRGDNGTCGIHVHISRKGIKEEAETVSKMLVLFSRHKEKICKFARRSDSRWSAFSAKTKKQYDEDPARFLDVERRERYRAINLQNSNTIELRIFKGTSNPDTIEAIILFCNAFVDFCEKLDFNKVEDITWEQIFVDKKEDAVYAKMFEFMKKKKIWDDAVATAAPKARRTKKPSSPKEVVTPTVISMPF